MGRPVVHAAALARKVFVVLALTISLMVGAVQAAPKAITVYSSVDEQNAKKILDAFTKSTGIPYKMVFLSSAMV